MRSVLSWVCLLLCFGFVSCSSCGEKEASCTGLNCLVCNVDSDCPDTLVCARGLCGWSCMVDDSCACSNDGDCQTDSFCEGYATCLYGVCSEVQPRCLGLTDCCGDDGESCACCGDCLCGSDADCNDGAFCTGVETCVGGSCQGTGSPCSVELPFCDELNDVCYLDANSCSSSSQCDDGNFWHVFFKGLAKSEIGKT